MFKELDCKEMANEKYSPEVNDKPQNGHSEAHFS